MKRVLIVSPYFPPVNSADMQRVRMSLPYFAQNDWEAEVVMVDEAYTDIAQDPLLLKSIDQGLIIHRVKALKKNLTAKLGLGSIALRALWFYRRKVNALLTTKRYDLIYFSTTQFPVCILGAYWKKRFGVPYVIDMQDPWHSEYYQDKPKEQRPKKYWFSYRLNKYLEPVAMQAVGGLISVSDSYLADLKLRYQMIKNVPAATITFGAFAGDMQIAQANSAQFENLLAKDRINIVYVGRGGADMHKAVKPLFDALRQGLTADPEQYENIRLYFIGTSYAAKGQGVKTIWPLALQYQLERHVVEIPDRISYYHTLHVLQQADGLFVPGSDDPKYTASKIYPYLLTQRRLLAIFHPQSSAIKILREYGSAHTFDTQTVTQADVLDFLSHILAGDRTVTYKAEAIEKYAASQMTKKQCELFNLVIEAS
jgi:hypothetical protein